MIDADRDASFLRMFDAFIESAPQLVLQIYLILKEQENMESCEDIEVHHRKFTSQITHVHEHLLENKNFFYGMMQRMPKFVYHLRIIDVVYENLAWKCICNDKVPK